MISEREFRSPDGQEAGIYVMSVAARLCKMHPQTLRKYERAGLLTPSRSGGHRLYSDRDIARLQMIKTLVEDGGLNLAGVELALDIHASVTRLSERIAALPIEEGLKSQLEHELEAILKLLKL